MELIICESDDPNAILGPDADESWSTITQIRERFQDPGGSGDLRANDPMGSAHVFTLDRWADRDPDTTVLQIAFRTRNPNEIPARKLMFP